MTREEIITRFRKDAADDQISDEYRVILTHAANMLEAPLVQPSYEEINTICNALAVKKYGVHYSEPHSRAMTYELGCIDGFRACLAQITAKTKESK